MAARVGSTPTSVSLAWLLHRSPNVLVIAGTSSIAHLRENVPGAGVRLSDADLADVARVGG